MQFLEKLEAIEIMQLCEKYAPSRSFFKDLSADFTMTSLGRTISGKPTSFERLQWLFAPFIYFYFPT